MKRLLLTLTVVGAAFWSQSQVIFRVDAPAAIGGSYDFTWADPAGGDWMTPNFLTPNTYIEDNLQLVTGGTADSLACTPLAPGSLTGNIAVVYRGNCEFGMKAMNAQNAGAIGVVIINNAAGAPIEMGGGANGATVTIPVAMISDIDGALIRAQLDASEVVDVFIGNKSGIFTDDLGFYPGDVLISPMTSVSALTSADASEFSFSVGGKVYNYGTAAQNDVTVTAEVTQNGSTVYTESTTAQAIPAGDSMTFTLPDFSLATYAVGNYELTYTIENGVVVDEYSADNVLTSEFQVDPSLVSYARLDPVSNKPLGDNGYRVAESTGEFSACIVYRDANASRLGVDGMWISALMGNDATSVGDSLYGEEILVTVYEWNDVFTDLNDPALDFTDLNQISVNSYVYPNTGVNGFQAEAVYAKFDQQIVLNDNQRYLFCEQTSNDNVFFTFDTETDYLANENEYLQPYYALNSPTGYSLGFTGVENPPSIAIATFPVAELSINELAVVDAFAYPNPTTDKVKVSIASEGNGTISVTDLNGRVVLTNAFTLNGGTVEVNLSSIEAGMYIFNVELENGKTAQFNVVKK